MLPRCRRCCRWIALLTFGALIKHYFRANTTLSSHQYPIPLPLQLSHRARARKRTYMPSVWPNSSWPWSLTITASPADRSHCEREVTWSSQLKLSGRKRCRNPQNTTSCGAAVTNAASALPITHVSGCRQNSLSRTVSSFANKLQIIVQKIWQRTRLVLGINISPQHSSVSRPSLLLSFDSRAWLSRVIMPHVPNNTIGCWPEPPRAACRLETR